MTARVLKEVRCRAEVSLLRLLVNATCRLNHAAQDRIRDDRKTLARIDRLNAFDNAFDSVWEAA